MADLAKHVPGEVRRHFVQAFKGKYGWCFVFDGSVRFRDADGGGTLPFAYGDTVAECVAMMKRHEEVRNGKA